MSDLEHFVVDYLEEAGSLVEPPAFGVYEVLLPEKVAERWQVPAYMELAFTDTDQEEATQLGYNHPLVEQMVQEANGRSASTTLYINNLRLNKSNIDELAINSWVILNARAQTKKQATTARVRSTYVRFNFKAALLSDDKQERLVSVLMDAHSGSRVLAADAIELRATAVTPDSTLQSLSVAPMRWQPKDGPPLKAPLNKTALTALLARAQTAVLKEMQADLTALEKRVLRFRQLDEARLSDYYHNLEKDLQSRLKNASADRRAGLQDKLTAVQTERAHKLADLNERYQVRINLSLLNLLIIQQPKLIHPLQIANRTTSIDVRAVWDPLLRQLEPLHCQVCGQPGQRLYLCFNGHLAHEDCLAPACIDCKRVFCQDCAAEIGVCAVCQQPLCHYSRILCSECGRYTCHEHQELCHADNGRPQDLTKQTATPPVKAATPPPAPPPPSPRRKRKKPPVTRKSKPKPAAKPAASRRKGPKPLGMEVVVSPNSVYAYLLGKKGKTLALRTWIFEPDEGGILRDCECEKGDDCKADDMIVRPFDIKQIEKQLHDELLAFAAEYHLSSRKIHYNRLSSLSGDPFPTGRFELFGLWKNEEAISHAQDTFARLYW